MYKRQVWCGSYGDDRPDASISYWTVLKDGWKKENPDRPVFEGQ